jgi:hypothetical protein
MIAPNAAAHVAYIADLVALAMSVERLRRGVNYHYAKPRSPFAARFHSLLPGLQQTTNGSCHVTRWLASIRLAQCPPTD